MKEQRYVTFVGYGGISVRRQGVQGLHVHVGMPGADECWRCLIAILPWLPVVLALSANSPWFAGELNGHGVEPRADPRRAAARRRRRRASRRTPTWEEWVERLVRLGVMEDYTRIWWDVRPHPKLGTLEVRVADQPTDVRLSAAFAALLQALCEAALDGRAPGRRAAAGDYIAEPLVCGALRPARRARPSGRRVACRRVASSAPSCSSACARSPRLGGGSTRIDPTGCEADLQLEVGRRAQEAAADARRAVGSLSAWQSSSETVQVSGIRCEKCVMRLAKTLEGAEGLESANANLMGQVHALLRRRAHHAGCARRADGPRRVPRAALRLGLAAVSRDQLGSAEFAVRSTRASWLLRPSVCEVIADPRVRCESLDRC